MTVPRCRSSRRVRPIQPRGKGNATGPPLHLVSRGFLIYTPETISSWFASDSFYLSVISPNQWCLVGLIMAARLSPRKFSTQRSLYIGRLSGDARERNKENFEEKKCFPRVLFWHNQGPISYMCAFHICHLWGTATKRSKETILRSQQRAIRIIANILCNAHTLEQFASLIFVTFGSSLYIETRMLGKTCFSSTFFS